MINTTASTQYNDWIGGAAFDNADITALSDYAKKNQLIGADDIIYSFEASYCHLRQEMMVSVFYTEIHFDEFKKSGAELSKKEFDVPVAEFFTLFKRANFAVAKKGL
ncbi:hypothetical protein ACN930_004814 [Vibrio parahaemolyticus]|uniref:hypothetical protein n=1 Tax=Vibrio TaxID=662 RepID=UPI0010D8DDC0|nr:hypothetical protein [Vibrio parahaemolyticus]EGR0693876.1 hypothetical protein [Vibrio parahaemolyticus]EGR2191063.1 hypothetical protein [Vibrio parahaemolyticus]MBE4733186.1 hypothetical protein [Vibrio parahaemolyticus]MBE4767208.1 hypothetical protein [Vibrio parahaemolyticus]TBT15560.1 hypothetical protein D5E83_24255 [Vibrio parahaemolyticus]